jgi:tRNA(Ile)-lysidine synthase
LPVLEASVPHAAAALARHAAIARDEAEWLAGSVNQAVARFVQTGEDVTRIDASLSTEPAALQRRVVLAALRAAGALQPGLDHVDAVRRLLGGRGRACEVAGGLRANRIGDGVVLTSGAASHHARPPAYRYSLQVPGIVRVPEASAAIAAFVSGEAPYPAPADAVEVEVDGEALGTSLIIRNWVAGDLIRSVRPTGRKKLQDVFVDAKVPRADRGHLPLVADEHDGVVWVPGLAIDGRLRVTSRSTSVVVLRLTKEQALPVGGPE